MIHSITGRVIEANGQTVVVRPGGGPSGEGAFPVELEIMIPAYWVEQAVESVGRVVRLHTKLHLESQNQGASFTPRLIGFPTADDRAFFDLFISVKGLGSRRALRAMTIEPAMIAAAISARDARALQKLPEIGKRLAETVIAALHGKLGAFAAELPEGVGTIEPRPAGGAADEAVAALIALGQTRAEAERAVSRALRGVDAAGLSADEIVTRAFAGG